MRRKLILILIVAGIAYLLGSRGGTERWQQLSGALESIWNDPKVKKARKQAAKDAKKAKKRLR